MMNFNQKIVENIAYVPEESSATNHPIKEVGKIVPKCKGY